MKLAVIVVALGVAGELALAARRRRRATIKVVTEDRDPRLSELEVAAMVINATMLEEVPATCPECDERIHWVNDHPSPEGWRVRLQPCGHIRPASLGLIASLRAKESAEHLNRKYPE